MAKETTKERLRDTARKKSKIILLQAKGEADSFLKLHAITRKFPSLFNFNDWKIELWDLIPVFSA